LQGRVFYVIPNVFAVVSLTAQRKGEGGTTEEKGRKEFPFKLRWRSPTTEKEKSVVPKTAAQVVLAGQSSSSVFSLRTLLGKERRRGAGGKGRGVPSNLEIGLREQRTCLEEEENGLPGKVRSTPKNNIFSDVPLAVGDDPFIERWLGGEGGKKRKLPKEKRKKKNREKGEGGCNLKIWFR